MELRSKKLKNGKESDRDEITGEMVSRKGWEGGMSWKRSGSGN